MDSTNINKIIQVGVVFSGGKLFPKWFLYDNKKHEIKDVNYTWDDHEGLEKLMLFSVSDDSNTYELSFNLKRMIWRLEKICIKI